MEKRKGRTYTGGSHLTVANPRGAAADFGVYARLAHGQADTAAARRNRNLGSRCLGHQSLDTVARGEREESGEGEETHIGGGW
jgi:hypothetical protein